jgi:putative ATPase
LNKLSTEEVHSILKKAVGELRGESDENETKAQENEDDNATNKVEAEEVDDEALEFLAVMSDGDGLYLQFETDEFLLPDSMQTYLWLHLLARTALNALEMAWNSCKGRDITKEDVKNVLQKTHLQYDRNGEEHYNIISALHKSMRGR